MPQASSSGAYDNFPGRILKLFTMQPRKFSPDCYPLQFIDTDEVKANIKKRAGQWETFTNYLESKGKLRK